jgi:hypothetical protein
MRVLYKDDARNQLVVEGTSDVGTKTLFQAHFDIVKESYDSREIGWAEWFDNLWVTKKYERRTLIKDCVYNKHNNNKNSVINTSVELLESVGIIIPDQSGVNIRCQEMNVDEDFETDFDRQHYYSFNTLYEYEEEKRTYGCIFCVKRDEDIKDGHLVFYPHFSDEIVTCFNSPSSIDLPELKEGDIVVMSGDTRYNIPKITGKGVMRLMYVIFNTK